MKLHEVADVPLIVSMARKLLDRGIPVHFDFNDKQRDYTRHASGPLLRITFEVLSKLPNTPIVYKIVYKAENAAGSDRVLLNNRRLELLKLYKNKAGQWVLSDRKPEVDGEEL